MTIQEFDQQKDKEQCQRCEAIGLERVFSQNNNTYLVRCAHCDSSSPWGHAVFLETDKSKKRRKRLPAGLREKCKKAFEYRCAACGKTQDELAREGQDLQIHHVNPYAVSEHDGPFVPYCPLCHDVVTALQRPVLSKRLKVRDSLQTTTNHRRLYEADDEETKSMANSALSQTTNQGRLYGENDEEQSCVP